MIVTIASPLEAELVARIAAAGADVLYDPALLPPARYPSDHRGDPSFRRSADGEERFWSAIARAEVLFGVPGDTGAGLAQAVRRAPGLRWIAGTAAGAGEQLRAAALTPDELARVVVTSAAGVHGTMLAEFAFYGILALRKDALRIARTRAERRWDHYANGELRGETVAIVGMGQIGQAVAGLARAFGMRTIGVTRDGDPRDGADESARTSALVDVCRRSDVVVVTLPATAHTSRLVGADAIAALPPDAILVNVGRGSVVDQPALTAALQRGAIAGAVLDVTDPEPLPPDDPLWSLDNVVLTTHTAALSVHENERIVELFLDNLARFRDGRPLRNAVDPNEFY